MTDFTVTRRSVDKIEQIARDTLAECPTLPSGAIDILTTLRRPWIPTIQGKKTLRLKLVADELLPEKFAQMWSAKDRVTITARTTLWNQAEENDPEALKVLRHEFSHGVLHSNEYIRGNVTLDRQLEGNKVHEFIHPEMRAENQADWLEACLAMPFNKISSSTDILEMMVGWNVTLSEAKWRMERVRAISPKRIPDAISRRIQAIHATSNISDDVQALWNALPLAPDYSPAVARLTGSFLVEYVQYQKYNQTGWCVECGKIVPLILKMRG